LKRVLDRVNAKCVVCGTPVDERYRRGNKYYCASDFERTSSAELIENVKKLKQIENYRKIYG